MPDERIICPSTCAQVNGYIVAECAKVEPQREFRLVKWAKEFRDAPQRAPTLYRESTLDGGGRSVIVGGIGGMSSDGATVDCPESPA